MLTSVKTNYVTSMAIIVVDTKLTPFDKCL